MGCVWSGKASKRQVLSTLKGVNEDEGKKGKNSVPGSADAKPGARELLLCVRTPPPPSTPISCPLEASFTGPADLSTGLGHKWSNLTGSENSEEWVEEGRYEGCCSKRHRLGHPVHGGHKQHVSTRGLLEGEERGT